MSMGVYIKRIEIPTHCIDCPFMVSRDNDDCILQSAEDNENFENWEQMKAGCPLVPVPPHGRLIDVSELEKRLYDYGTGTTLPIDWSDIANAPTVIEEEVSE